jgi:hypothetical protein
VSVEVRPPVGVDGIGRPDVSVRPFIDPGSAPAEFILVIGEIGGKVPGVAPLCEEVVPGLVPLAELVDSSVEIGRLGEKPPVDRGDLFLGPDEEGPFLSGRFGGTFDDEELGLTIRPDIDSEKPFFQKIKRGVRGVDFDFLFVGERAHPQIDVAVEEMELDPVVALAGQQGEFHLGVLADPEEVLAAEMDLGLSDLRADLVSLDEGEIELSFFISEVRGPLDEDIAADIVQPGETVGIITVVILGCARGRDNEESEDC